MGGLPQGRTLPVIQVGVLGRLDDKSDASGGGEAVVVAEAGVIQMLSGRYGVGGGFFYQGDTEFSRGGFKARVRRSLGSRLTLDVSPGITFAASGNVPHSQPYGYVGGVDLAYGPWITLTGQVESFTFVKGRLVDFETIETWEETGVSWYLGGKVGSVWAIPAVVLAVVAIPAMHTSW